MARFPFRAVIFDMDGVLVDTEYYYQGQLATYCSECGLDVSAQEIAQLVGTSHKVFQKTLVGWWARCGIERTPEAALEAFNSWIANHPCDYLSLMNEGVPETLSALHKQGVRVALASSSPMVNIRQVLAACHVENMFEVVVSGEQFHESKPHPEIYLHTLESLGLSAHECCCLEDSAPGITAGRAAGLTVIAKREDRFGFSQDQAHAVIDTIPEVLELDRVLAVADLR